MPNADPVNKSAVSQGLAAACIRFGVALHAAAVGEKKGVSCLGAVIDEPVQRESFTTPQFSVYSSQTCRVGLTWLNTMGSDQLLELLHHTRLAGLIALLLLCFHLINKINVVSS